MVARTLTHILGHAGLAVTAAARGEDALLRLRDRPDAFAVVLLDLSMPGIGGVATLRSIRTFAPRLPVVVVSGTPLEDVEDELRGLATAFVQKPFRPLALLEVVQRFVSAS